MINEVLDIFDEQMNWVGTAQRVDVHRMGYWHQTFHCWVLHKTVDGDYVLLQRRHSTKDTHPNLLDISCAGHLDAGENPMDGVRELREELGLDVRFEDLYKVGLIPCSHITSTVKDNEFCHVFLFVPESSTLSQYKPALGELSGLYLIGVREMEQLCFGEMNQVQIQGYEVNDEGNTIDVIRAIRMEDMVKQEPAYYMQLFQGIRQLLQR